MVAMSDFFGENQQVVHVSWCPCRRQILGELVRINFHLADNIFAAPVLSLPIRKEIEPFIIGVGDVVAEDTPEDRNHLGQ